jgi:hypothetical protein
MARQIRDGCGGLLTAPFAEQFPSMTRREIGRMMES